MITLYGVLKFLHILGAAIWLGSNATTVALRALAVRTGKQIRTLVLIRETDRIQLALVSPAVGLLIGTGIWLVLEGGWVWGAKNRAPPVNPHFSETRTEF